MVPVVLGSWPHYIHSECAAMLSRTCMAGSVEMMRRRPRFASAISGDKYNQAPPSK